MNTSTIDPGKIAPAEAPRLDRVMPASFVRRKREPFLWLLCLLLLVYAVLGRSGAHLGLTLGSGTGIYIGDLVLLFGIASSLVEGSYARFFKLPIALLWVLFVAWNAAQTVPYLSQYGLIAVRDGALWGYSLFAVIVASGLLANPSAFTTLFHRFAEFARFYVYGALAMAPLAISFPTGALGFDFPPPVTNFMPHVAATTVFVLCRFVTVPAIWWMATATVVVAIGSQGRGAIISFLAAAGVIWLLNPWRLRLRLTARNIGLFGGLCFLLAAALTLDLNLGTSGSHARVIGPGQVLQNIAGSFTSTGDEDLNGTRQWRLEIWNRIIDYTVFGPYFWSGKGYGINLLDDAGMQVDAEQAVRPRAPENSHLSLLARSGVPGFLLWVALQAAWAGRILRALVLARRSGRRRTTAAMSFLLAVWTTFMVFSATAPVLESPFEGIWFWTIFGVGVAAAQMVRRDPDFFERIGGSPTAASPHRDASFRYAPRFDPRRADGSG
jgi:hypothetical protein